jgi:3-hydroxyphenylacetate 6-hydroxylase
MAINKLLQHFVHGAKESPALYLAISAALTSILYVVVNEFVRKAARVPGLGGPRGFPLIGNLWQIRKNAAEKYRSWAKLYGSVYQIQLGNIPVVVVNSAASAKVLFGQNAQALSSRPEFYTFHKVCSPQSDLPIFNRLFGIFNANYYVLRFSLTQLERPSERRHTVIL